MTMCYFLTKNDGLELVVSKEEWIAAERRAGFYPKLPSDHVEHYKEPATGGFAKHSKKDSIEGKIRNCPCTGHVEESLRYNGEYTFTYYTESGEYLTHDLETDCTYTTADAAKEVMISFVQKLRDDAFRKVFVESEDE